MTQIQALKSHPEFVAAVERQEAFARKLDELGQAERELVAAIESRANASTSPLARAAHLLDGGPAVGGAEREQLAKIQHDMSLIRAGQTAQSEAIQAMQQELSVKACASVRDNHRALASEMAALLVKHDQLIDAEIAMLKPLEAAGYSTASIGTLRWHVVGRVADGDEAGIARRIKDLQAYAKGGRL